LAETAGLSSSLEISNGLPLPRRLWWPWTEPTDYVGFDRSFTLPNAVDAVLGITASGPFIVWLDGDVVSIDPTHLPPWRTVAWAELHLQRGSHHLSCQVQTADQEQPFFLGCLDWPRRAPTSRLPTDQSWLMARMPPAGWQSRELGAVWQPAWAFDGVWAEPWGMPCDAPGDWLRLSTGWQSTGAETLTHADHLFHGLAGANGKALVRPDGSLVLRPVKPYAAAPPSLPISRPRLEWYRTRESHSLINNSWLAMLEQRAPHVIFDLGAETFGRLKVGLCSGGRVTLAITTGESRAEVDRYDRRVTDIVILRDGEGFSTSPTGFRYVKVVALAGEDPVSVLEPIQVQHIRYPAQSRGSFECEDDIINQVWDASEKTVWLCMQNEIWDGVKRDQLPWMGDLYVEALAVYHLYGDSTLARRTYQVLGQLGPAPDPPLRDQIYPGLQAIWRTRSGYINDIPSYSLWWLIGLRDYVRYTGDMSLISDLLGELEAITKQLVDSIRPDSTWQAQAGWEFIDWAPLSPGERSLYMHMLATAALRAAQELLARVSADFRSGGDLPNRMNEVSRRRLDDDGTGSGHHIPALAIASGVVQGAHAEEMFAKTLAADPPLRMTYWHRYLDLEAAREVRQIAWGLRYIRQHWGSAVSAGHATLWEAFDQAWLSTPDPHAATIVGSERARYGGYETSLCHGWAAGPVPWLHRAVLGVQPVSDGFRTVSFRPCLGDLSKAEGVIPTPLGDIRVQLEQRSTSTRGLRKAELTIPSGVRLDIPEYVRHSWDLRIHKLHNSR